MKINAKNTAAIKTNVKLKMQQEEEEGARVSEKEREMEMEAGGKSLSCIFSFYDQQHKANQ